MSLMEPSSGIRRQIEADLDQALPGGGTSVISPRLVLDRFRARLRFFPMSQQALTLGVLLLNDRVISSVIHVVMGVPQPPATYWLAPLLGMLLWPPLHLLLDHLRLRRQ